MTDLNDFMARYRDRKVYVLVKGLPPTESQKTYLMTLVDTRCPMMSDEERARLRQYAETMNGEWASMTIDELRKHPKKGHGKCWRCTAS